MRPVSISRNAPAARVRRRRGFTLAEALVALTLMTLGVALFGAFFPNVSRSLNKAQKRDLAADLCLRQIEFWRTGGYNALPPVPSGKTSVTVSFTTPSTLPASTGTITFTRVDQNLVATTTDTGRVRADVIVRWTTSASDTGEVRVASIITRIPF